MKYLWVYKKTREYFTADPGDKYTKNLIWQKMLHFIYDYFPYGITKAS